MSSKIRKGDEVVILSGKYRKLRGKVLSVFPKKGKLIVSGINLVKKHQKPIPAMNVEGGIVEKEAPLFIGKVALFNPETKRPERIGFRIEEGKKIRFFKSTGKAVPCAE